MKNPSKRADKRAKGAGKPEAPPEYSDEQIMEAAKASHEANKTYCESIGDVSQPPWDEAPDWQKDSAVAGVKFHIENPDAKDAASHDSWLAQKEADGWVYGDVKDEKAKTHPCIVPFEDLPLSQQSKDGLFRETVWASLGGNHEPEEGGGEADGLDPNDPPPAEEVPAKEPTLADDKRVGAVDPETGEPKDDQEWHAAALKFPGAFSPEDVAAMIIKGLDRLALCMTPEVRTRQSELFQVFQLYAAERPSIIERQKRLQLRRNQG